MTRHRIAQIGENRNPKSPENRPQTRRFLQIRILQLRRSATPFNGLAVLHGRLLSYTGNDGSIGFGSGFAYTFAPMNRAVGGAYDFIGTAVHEISEVLGRVAFLGGTVGSMTNAIFAPRPVPVFQS